MTESIQIIHYWLQTYYADGVYLLLALGSYIYLFAHYSELRKKFLAPIALIAVLVFNPLLHREIYSEIIYWRLFWMFPTGILIALATVKLVRNSRGEIGKGLVLLMICALIVIKGTNTYTEHRFGKTENAHKVPAAVKEVCDLILECEEKPKCILPETLFHDARQYSGEIRMAYGRDIFGYIIPNEGEEGRAYEQMESATPDYSWIMQYAEKKKCSFIVTYENKGINEELLVLYGYVEIPYDGNYKIYYNGQRSEQLRRVFGKIVVALYVAICYNKACDEVLDLFP